MKTENGPKQILRSSSIIGGASLLTILVSLVRTKVLAVLLGPSGVGLVGLLQTLMTTASSIAAMGLGTAGTRQIAEAVGRDEGVKLFVIRRALFWATLLLAAIGAAITWLLREPIAKYVLTDPRLANEIGWLACGVALTVATGGQVALLNGMRRIGDMARLSIMSGLVSTLIGLLALWLWGRSGLIVFILAAPLSSFLLGQFVVSRLPKLNIGITPLPVLMAQWRELIRLGLALMLTGLIWNAGHLTVRTLLQRELGAENLGYFQAAWAISMTYMGFVLQAMGADYYPRLSSSMHDQSAVNTMVNEQTQVALLLAAPVLLATLGWAPWIMELLYTRQFSTASLILQLQILGDILRVVAWPLGYVILASGDGRSYLMVESIAVGVLVTSIWLGLPIVGINITGIGFLLMYLFYLPTVYFIAKEKTGFCWTKRIFIMVSMIFACGVFIAVVASLHAAIGALLGGIASAAFGIFALIELSRMANLTGPLAHLVARYRRLQNDR